MDNKTAENALIEMAKSVGLSDTTHEGIIFSKTFGTFSRWSYVQDNSIPVLAIDDDHFVIYPVMLGYDNSQYPTKINVNWVSPVMSRPYDNFTSLGELESVVIPAVESVLKNIDRLETYLNILSIQRAADQLKSLL